MKPSELAKSLGAKSLSEVATAYGVHPSYLNQIFKSNQVRLENMIKVYVLAKKLNIKTTHLQFMLESVLGNIEGTNAAHYFMTCPEAREELTRAYVADFKTRMYDMCQKLLTDIEAQAGFRDVVHDMVKAKDKG